jgi:hypothetical protein
LTPTASAASPPPRPDRPTYTPPDYSKGAPGDAAYDLGVTAADTAYNAAIGAIGARRVASGEDYGFDTTTGTMLANVDVSNPFSRAALMNRSFRQQDKTTRGGFGVGNRLTSGAYAAALSSNQFGQLGRQRGLEREFKELLAEYSAGESDAFNTRETTKAQLMGELIQRRMQQDAINAEQQRAAVEAAQAEWDAKYGGAAPQGPSNPPPTSGPSGAGPIGAPGRPWIDPGNPFGTSVPANAGAIMAALAAKPRPKPKPKPKGKRK